MKIIRWVHKLFEHVQNFRTDLLKLHGREEHRLNWLSLSFSLLEWPGMTRNDHSNKLELSIRPHSGVDSAQWDWGMSWAEQISVWRWGISRISAFSKLTHVHESINENNPILLLFLLIKSISCNEQKLFHSWNINWVTFRAGVFTGSD